MGRFRYDAVVQVRGELETVKHVEWGAEEVRLEELGRRIGGGWGGKGVRVERVAWPLRLAAWMKGESGEHPWEEAKAEWGWEELMQEGRDVHLRYGEELGRMDVVVCEGEEGCRLEAAGTMAGWDWKRYVNDPGIEKWKRGLVARLKKNLSRQLPEHMVPSGWVVLEQLPRTANDKVDRAALHILGSEQAGRQGAAVPPRNPLEAALAALWSDVLGGSPVGVTDNFFQLGGHSLLATQLIAQIRQVFRINLSLQTVFQEPTVAAQAVRLVSLAQASGEQGEARLQRTALLLVSLSAMSPHEVKAELDRHQQAQQEVSQS